MAGLTESSSSGSLTDSVCTTYESNPTQNKKGSGSGQGVTDSVPEESVPDNSPSDSDLQNKTTPPTSYASLLEGLLQSVSSKISPKSTAQVDKSVQYSYSDFSQVDHRIKLFLFSRCISMTMRNLYFFSGVMLQTPSQFTVLVV